LKVVVDEAKCRGHGRCYDIAEDLFDMDDLGYAHVVEAGDVSQEQEAAARLAVASCPERAITIIEDGRRSPGD
jgi:ferredoxin